MLEVVFSDSAAGALSVAFGHKDSLAGAAGVIFLHAEDNAISKAELERLQREAEDEANRSWANSIPLEGNPKNIINLPLALSVGGISETGIGAEREAAISLLMGTYPDMASDVVNNLLNTAHKSFTMLLEQAKKGASIRVWSSRNPDERCGLYWLMEQLRPIGLEQLDITLVELPEWESRSDGCVVRYNSWGDIEPYLFGKMALLGNKLPANYLRGLANHWKELQAENANLRAVLNGELVSVPESLYDVFILRELEKQEDEFMEARLVGRVLGEYQLGISDSWISLRIEHFIKDGLLTPVTTSKSDDPIYHRLLRKNR